MDHLATCPPPGVPVALGGIDYAKAPGAGTIWLLAVHAALRSCGVGTLLIVAAEQRVNVGMCASQLGSVAGVKACAPA